MPRQHLPLTDGRVGVSHKARARGLDLIVASAGTGAWHVGEAPDPRAQDAARARGYDMSAHRARQLADRDFQDFDLILAMDAGNLRDATRRAPAQRRARIVRFLDHAGFPGDVPDPYYSGGFDEAITLIEDASERILDRIERGA